MPKMRLMGRSSLGPQFICDMGFEFPTMGDPIFGNLNTFLFTQPFSLPHKVAPFLSEWLISFHNVLSRISSIFLILISYL